MSPAGISAITTTGVQMARGKSFKEAAKDGLKVGAAIGIGTAFTGGSIGAGFGVGPGAVPIESFSGALDAAGRSVGQVQRLGQTVWDKVSSPFETVVNPKTGEKVLEVFGLPTKAIGDIATGAAAIGSSVAAYKDAKTQQEANQALAEEQKRQAAPLGPGEAFTIGGVQSPADGSTPPPIDVVNPIVAPGLGQPQEGQDFAIPGSQFAGYNPYAFLSEQAQAPEEMLTPDASMYQNPFAQVSPEQFLAMYGPQQGPQGIATFAKGGPVTAAMRGQTVPPSSSSNKPYYVNSAGRQISKAEWEKNQARMKAENDAQRQRDRAFLANQAAAKKAADQRKFEKETLPQLRQQSEAKRAAEQAAQQTVLHVHVVHMLLNFALNVAHIGTLLSRAIEITV
jgi:hypothetical protein